MDKNIILGQAKVVSGKIKKSVGKVISSPKLQVEGEVNQWVGNAQSAIGRIKEIFAEESENAKAKISTAAEVEEQKNNRFFRNLANSGEEHS